jgi:hypothetical protein
MRTRIRVSPGGSRTSTTTGWYYFTDPALNPRLVGTYGYNPDYGVYMWTYHPAPPYEFTCYFPEREVMYEVTTDVGKENTRSSWNRFEHYKRSVEYNTGSCTVGTSLYLPEGLAYDRITCVDGAQLYREELFGPAIAPINGLEPLLKMQNQEILYAPAHLNELKKRSLQAMLPGIRPQLSLINSVIELKDFKTLPRTISRITALAKRSGNVLRRVLGGGADVYLQKEFNIVPLLSDIAGIQRALKNTSEQVKRLLTLERKVLTRHFYAPLDPKTYQGQRDTSSNFGPSVVINGSPGRLAGNFKAYRTVTYDKAQFHAEIQYSYFLSEFQRENAAILGLADALGVNLNPAILWNALPWSFVVDWVIDVSRWLDQFKVGNLEPVTVIHRYLWSSEIRRRTRVDIETNLDVPTLPKPMVHAVDSVESTYKRELGSVSFSDITTSGVSLKEFSLAGALALSRKH